MTEYADRYIGVSISVGEYYLTSDEEGGFLISRYSNDRSVFVSNDELMKILEETYLNAIFKSREET